MEILLLPGLDGTGRLFARLRPHLAWAERVHVASFPSDRVCTYDDLLESIVLPAGPVLLVAESFSGPLAVRLCARHPGRVRGLVLVASFVRSPAVLPQWLVAASSRGLFRLARFGPALRFGLLGLDAPSEDVEALRDAIGSVRPEVLAARLRAVVAVDASREFAALTVPVLYIAGARDRLVGPRVMRDLMALRSDLATAVLDAPHLVLQRRPERAARLIRDFTSDRDA